MARGGAFFGLRSRRLRRGQPKKDKQDRGSGLLIVVGLYALILISFTLSIRRLGRLPNGVQYAGDLLMVVGMVIRYSAIRQLGRFFSPRVGVVRDQEIIQSGWYRRIRHPAYTGGWITAVGMGLAMRTWWGPLLCGGGLLLVYTYRIRIEEHALLHHFGEPYARYMTSTKGMFPRIW